MIESSVDRILSNGSFRILSILKLEDLLLKVPSFRPLIKIILARCYLVGRSSAEIEVKNYSNLLRFKPFRFNEIQ